jgi:hypothetical protein
MKNKLDICKQTRKFAAETLVIALKKLLKSQQPISEVDLRMHGFRRCKRISIYFLMDGILHHRME